MTEQFNRTSRGWIVVFAALAINLVTGTIYAWSVIGKATVMHPEWRWTKTQAALPFAAATASFAITMIFAGRMQDKLGPRLIVTLGGLVLGCGFIAASMTHSPQYMALALALVGVGIGLAYSATTPASIKWFPPARKGLITGIVVSGVGLSAAYASPLTQFLLNRTGSISQTLLILGIGSIIVIAILAQLMCNPPAGYVAASAPAAGGSARVPAPAVRREMDWHQMLATPQFYLLWSIFILSASAGLMLIANVASIAKVQVNWEAGFLAVVLLSVFNFAGRLAAGFASDRLGRTNTMVLAFLLQAVNMFAFAYYSSPAMLLFGAGFTGFCYGGIFALMPAATADFYGVRNLGVNYGLVFTAFGVAGVLGSLLGGRVADLFGSYAMAYRICGVMLIAAAALAFATRAPKPAPEAMPQPA
jgi:OFA family oxalate/formate antiporter-like MFS transporter